MAVVTHGSFDEGPIVLALPPVYEYAAAEETDPVFSAWDKSSHITIDHTQITHWSDSLSDLITSTDLTDALENYYTTSEVDVITGAISTEMLDLVPYSGATTDVNLGSNDLSANRLYTANETPISSDELVSKAYVDDLAFTGAGGISPTVAHNDTTGKEGGGAGHYYHLSSATNSVVSIITDTSTADTVTGLTVSSTGITTGTDGTQSAYVILEWDASTYSAFDHYIVAYQKDGNLGWVEVISTTNTIMIEGLIAGIEYNFKVYSVNKYGTVSTESDTISYTMDSDTQAPGVTTVDAATGGIQMILIEWTHNIAADLSHYNVYRNTTNNSGTATLKGNTKSNRYTDAPLPISTTYYYWVKAVDTSGNECSTFSSEVHATTRAVQSADVESISANKILITGTTYLSNWTGTDSTKIDGANIETGTLTLSKLQFTTGLGYGLVGAINAYEDGVQLNASNISISGATVFTSKVGGTYTSSTSPTTLSRISIYPDSNTGIKVTDNLGNSVFLVEIGGTNVGDVTIGNWAGSQGIKYDKSAGTTTFMGTIHASGGSMSGITSFSTTPDASYSLMLDGPNLYEYLSNTDSGIISINYKGYSGGYTKYRDTIIGDGKGNPMLIVDGSAKTSTIFSNIVMSGTDISFRLSNLTTAQRTALTKAEGLMVYDTDVRRVCCVIKNNVGTLEWWTVAMNTNLG